MLPAPIWPLAEHAEFGQNCCDASIGSVWFCILDSMPVDACFCKSSFPFHRLVELYHNFLSRNLSYCVFTSITAKSIAKFIGNVAIPFFIRLNLVKDAQFTLIYSNSPVIRKKIMKEFTVLLETFRDARQLSKKELAQRANLSTGYISLLTSGARKAPSEESVAALADALELDIKDRSRFFEAAGFPAHYALLNFKANNVKADWGEAPNVQAFYGRIKDLEDLENWIVHDRCQLVAVFGMAGVGKTMLSVRVGQTI